MIKVQKSLYCIILKKMYNKNVHNVGEIIHRGFTLAEVLITIGIIGVVASMTMPSLNQKLSDQRNMAALKKTYSVLQQATNLAISEHEGPEYWGMVDNNNDVVTAIYNYYKPYFNMIADRYMGGNDMVYKLIPNGTYNYGSCYFITLSDGSDICINNYGSSADSYVAVYIDVNGVNKLPNTAGLDFFKVEFTNNGVLAQLVDDGSALSRCTESHSGAPYECFIRVVKDNWEITYY